MLTKLIEKIVKKEELSSDDLKNLQDEISKLTADGGKKEKDIAKLQTEVDKYKKQLEDIETAKLSDIDKLKKQVEKLNASIAEKDSSIATLSKERDEANSNHAKLKRSHAIKTIATTHSFDDGEYLDVLLANGNIDIDNETNVNTFMEQLKKDRPKLFSIAQAKSGTPPQPAPQPKNIDNGNKVDSIMDLISNAKIVD